MEDAIKSLVEKYGSQDKAALALGVNPRTFRNYIRRPESIPNPVRLAMQFLLNGTSEFPPQPDQASASEASAC